MYASSSARTMSKLSWIYSFIISCTVCHHSFHFGFLLTNVWFYTLSKALSKSNSSNSFKQLSMYVVWKTLPYTLQSVSNSPFNPWICTRSSWVWFSMSMLTSVNYSLYCKHVFFGYNKFLLLYINGLHLAIVLSLLKTM
jgi:hypothetical protein